MHIQSAIVKNVFRANLVTVLKSRGEARVTIQEIKSLGHVTKRDVFLFINSKILDFEVAVSTLYVDQRSE